jgi:hypothetical protein
MIPGKPKQAPKDPEQNPHETKPTFCYRLFIAHEEDFATVCYISYPCLFRKHDSCGLGLISNPTQRAVVEITGV